MVEFEDQDYYLTRFLLPLAGIAYLLVLLVRAVNVLQWTIAAILSLLTYFVLNKFWPATYPIWTTMMLLTCCGIMAALVGLVYAAAWLFVLVAGLSLAVPTLQHNADLIAVWLGAEQWVGFLLLGVSLLALVTLVYLSQTIPLVGLLLKVIFTSVFLQVMLRHLYLERPPAMDRLDMACFSSTTDPPGRCALSFDSYVWFGVLAALVTLQVFVLYKCRCKKKKQKQKQKKKTADRSTYDAVDGR